MKKTSSIKFDKRKSRTGLMFSLVVFLLLLLGPASYKFYTYSIFKVYASVESLGIFTTLV